MCQKRDITEYVYSARSYTFLLRPVTLYYVMLRYNYVGDALLLRHFTLRKRTWISNMLKIQVH